MPINIHITKVNRDELIKHTFDELVEKNNDPFDAYDVDAFYTDVVNVRWDKIFVIDETFLKDFNCAVINFIISDNHFDTPDKVIITSELFYYSYHSFGNYEETKEVNK